MADAHPRAMAPPRPGSTRTAPPRTPASWPAHSRYRIYTLFGATGAVYLLQGLLMLRVAWNLGAGPDAWGAVMESFRSPFYVVWHAFALACVLFVGVRFFRLFPKAQPAAIGPLRPPPQPVIHATLYVIWLAVSAVGAWILAGGLAG